MNELEQRLTYPFGEALPEPGKTLDVAPGIKWIRMSLPFALNHINLWLLRDIVDGRDGWTAVDCCISHDASKEQWTQVIEGELEGLPILRVLVTHMHPDHVGMAYWLCERYNAPLWMSATDYHVARLSSQSTTGFGGERAALFFASHGLVDSGSLEKIRNRASYYPNLVPDVPRSFHRLMDGYRFTIGEREWTCISGYGHAPEHIALYAETDHVLIGGDMMLPRISTNVSVYETEPEADSLRLFLESIDRFSPLPEDTLTLPAHGKPFRGLHERIRQLQDHHRDRLAEVMQACSEKPCSGADILPIMFKRPLDLHQTTFAMGEAVAHLHAKWFEGQLRRTLGEDGVYRFSA
ncbi:MAG: MBL fold metallo-hydrolase [Comamonadaceae bacterium]|nr:MAG: MBL fold metallo-hydrolase [Comamonadaceae bacterium]